MRTFLTKLLFKLPASILIRWSGKEQIEKGYRKLDPGFQYLMKIMENIGAKQKIKIHQNEMVFRDH